VFARYFSLQNNPSRGATTRVLCHGSINKVSLACFCDRVTVVVHIKIPEEQEDAVDGMGRLVKMF